MAWTDKIFAYCERAGDPAFWAEPFNAVSNIAFLLAAVAAAVELARRADAGERRMEWALVALVGIIGTGSFLFHTYATRWASVADTAPIGIFMIGYLGYAMRRFLHAPVLAAVLALGLFLVAMRHAGAIPCDPALLPITVAAGRPCFNGSLGYLPALAALVIIGGMLFVRRHAAGGLVWAGALVFGISLTFRTLDFEVCDHTLLLGRTRGTHALWHMLNAALLYMLLIAAIRHGGKNDAVSI
jgi:hypothetical protein